MPLKIKKENRAYNTNISSGPVSYNMLIDPANEGLIFPHVSLRFSDLFSSLVKKLRYIFHTPDEYDFCFIPVSGTGAIEILMLNALQPGDKILILSNGYFGERLFKIAEAIGLKPYGLKNPWDSLIIKDHIIDFIQSKEFAAVKAVFMVHLETSTGLLNNIETIGKELKKTNTLFLVDAVSSAGSHDINVESSGIDGLVTVTYKGFRSPGGVSIMGISKKYYNNLIKKNECEKVKSYFFDLERNIYFSRKNRTATTIAVNSLIILNKALEKLVYPDPKKRYREFRETAHVLREKLASIGFRCYCEDGLSHTVTAFYLPGTVTLSSSEFKKILETKYGIYISGGLGKLENSIIRIASYEKFSLQQINNIKEVFLEVLEENSKK
jgi:aspartate aminotransferase-like enzyme